MRDSTIVIVWFGFFLFVALYVFSPSLGISPIFEFITIPGIIAIVMLLLVTGIIVALKGMGKGEPEEPQSNPLVIYLTTDYANRVSSLAELWQFLDGSVIVRPSGQ